MGTQFDKNANELESEISVTKAESIYLLVTAYLLKNDFSKSR